ncbi:ArnT family glycosyltransferase [Paenibacillus harenae]|uniref:ArnT family glycosyltransferase n=1 Tax=Paenibacillus harenae TaxID=306543 RepID=UPI000429DC6C|nr:glycosyltransferase family 39 protein [Paenibacillus harenae]
MKGKIVVYISLIVVILSLIPRLLYFDSTEIIGTIHSLRQLDVATIARNILIDPSTFFSPTLDRGEGLSSTLPMTVGLEFQLMPLIVAALYSIFGIHTSFGSILSILFYLGSCLFIYKIAERYLGMLGIITTMAIFCFSSQYIVYSKTFMPESEVIFFLLFSFCLFQKFLDDPKRSKLVLFIFILTLSMLVKLTNAYMLPVYMYLLYKNRKQFSRKSFWMIFTSGVFSLIITLFYYYIINARADTPYVSGILSNLILKNFGQKFVDVDYWDLFFKYLVIYFSPLGILLAIIGSKKMFSSNQEFLVWFICVFIFEFVSGYAILSNHIYYFLPTVPIGALLIGAGFQAIIDKIKKFTKSRIAISSITIIVLVFLVLQLLFLYQHYGFTGNKEYARLQRQDGEELNKYFTKTKSSLPIKIGLLRWEEYPVLYYSEQLGWMFTYEEDPVVLERYIQELVGNDCKYLYISSRDLTTTAAKYLISKYEVVELESIKGRLLEIN